MFSLLRENKSDSSDSLLMDKILTFHSVIILIKSVLNKKMFVFFRKMFVSIG